MRKVSEIQTVGNYTRDTILSLPLLPVPLPGFKAKDIYQKRVGLNSWKAKEQLSTHSLASTIHESRCYLLHGEQD